MKRKGFTLLELSVVLVVIGLIVGAVVAGMNLTKNAQTQSVINEFGAYKAAINTFKDKFGALPGDMSDASSFWSTVSNGNGDGQVCCLTDESAEVWEHLSAAQLILGDYTSTGSIDPGVTSPLSKASNKAFWWYWYVGLTNNGYGSGNNPINGQTGNFLTITGRSSNNNPRTGVLTPAEALGIDQKIDDGNPSSGNMLADDSYEATGTTWDQNCTNGGDYLSAAGSLSYDVDNPDRTCRILFATE